MLVVLSVSCAHSQTITLTVFVNNSDYKEENIEKKITLKVKQELENRGYRVSLLKREEFKKGLENKGMWISGEINKFYLGTTLFSFGPFRYRIGNLETETNLQVIKNGKLFEEPVEIKGRENKTNFILFGDEEEIEKKEEEAFDNFIKEKFFKEITEEITSKLQKYFDIFNL